MRPLGALLVCALLAGCADPATTDEAGDGTLGPGDTTENATADGPGLAAVLTAQVANGTAPLAVTFNVSALGAGPNVTWKLDFGDGNATNGTRLPAEANHTFEGGNFTATLTVLDGEVSAQASLTISVDAGVVAPPPGGVIQETFWEGEGLLVVGLQICGGQDGVDYAEHDWDASQLVSQAYAVANIELQMTNGPGTLDLDITLLDPEGSAVGSSTAFDVTDGPESISGAGPYPAGVYTLQVSACSGAAMEYEWQLTAQLVTI